MTDEDVSRDTQAPLTVEESRRATILAVLPMTPPDTSTGYAADLAALERRAHALSGAVDAALRTVVPDPTAVRACGRVLGLNKNLAWKLVNLAAAPDIATVLSSLPGKRGWQKTMEAFAESDCDEALIEELQAAIAGFDREIADRGIDRTTLTAMAAGGLDSDRSRDEYRRLREQAMLANRTLWGTAADVLGSTYVLTRSGTDDLLDILSLSWFHGLHRTGPGPRCRVFMATSSYSDRAEDAVLGEAIARSEVPCLIPELSSADAADELIVRHHADKDHVFLAGAGTSPSRGIDLVFGERLEKAAYIHARHEREVGTFGTTIHIPCSWTVLEVLVERSIPLGDSPEAATYSQVSGPAVRNHWIDVQRLPMAEGVRSGLHVDLPGELREARKSHQKMLTFAAKATGRSLADFMAHQIVVPFPVLSSNLLLRTILSPAPRSGSRRSKA